MEKVKEGIVFRNKSISKLIFDTISELMLLLGTNGEVLAANTIFVEFTPFEVKLISPEFFATISVPDLSEVNVFPEVFISILLPESSEVTFNIELPFATTPVPIPAFFMIISPPVDEWILVTSVVC